MQDLRERMERLVSDRDRVDKELRAAIAEIKITTSEDNVSDDKEYEQKDFWTGDPTSKVKHTCKKGYVLTGMEFDMLSKNFLRTPVRIKYICRQLLQYQ
jgi:hypothetical protein